MIACDIVLLPPEEVMKRIVEINEELLKKNGNEIGLDIENCLPHITVAMGCVKEEDLEKIGKVLLDISRDYPPVKICIESSKGGKAWLKIDKNRDVELLHEIVMIRLSSFFTHDVSTGMVFKEPDEDVNATTIEYIKKFKTASSFENYVPHITVGSEAMDLEIDSFEFVAKKIALCHLGNFCTCRKVLLEHTLQGGKGKEG